MKKITLLSMYLLLISTTIIQAQVINPTSATSDTSGVFGTALSATIDGTGLESFPSLVANHEATIPSNSYVTDATSGFFDFEFDIPFTISGFSFWNQNDGGPGDMGSTGLNEVTISSSIDGTTFELIPGAPTSFSQITTGVSGPEIFSFDAINATVIRIEFTSNHGDTNTGFGEIAFDGVELGLSEQELLSSITLYPNPSDSQITIENNSKIALSSIAIYDITGKLLINETPQSALATSININGLAKGVYIVKIEGDGRSVSKRLIKI